MQVRPYTVRVDRDELLVVRENVVVGYGRWTGSRIEALTGELIPAPEGEDAAGRAARLAVQQDALRRGARAGDSAAEERRRRVAALHANE